MKTAPLILVLLGHATFHAELARIARDAASNGNYQYFGPALTTQIPEAKIALA
jgi:hypothetical protein